MPYQDSPGWERHWDEFSWEWDFHVSTVQEGHRGANDKDKAEAKGQGAKLTFGEVLDCGVLRMLSNLGAERKSSFHDLGMGPGKMLIQTYLRYPNMRRCMGVELAKGRYDLGERNIRALLKAGWRGRTFLGVEFKKGEFFKIVEDVPDKTPAQGWKVGDSVVAYSPFLKKEKMMVKDYHGVITEIKAHASDVKKNVYAIKYDDGTVGERVQHRYLFVPGTERTCEVWYGSLFDYPNGFDAEMCILETDFPEEMHPHLIKQMCSTPIGCTFLTYHDLKKFSCFNWDELRQIDCNIYDNDRYITSWSQGWRFYIWEHVPHPAKEPHYTPFTGSWMELKKCDQILFGTEDVETLNYGEVITVSGDKEEKSDEVNLLVKTCRVEKNSILHDNIPLSSTSKTTIHRTRHRFRIGQHVSAYFSDNFNASRYEQRFQIYKAQVIGVTADKLSYFLKYTGDTLKGITREVEERYVNEPPKLLYKVGEQVMACWPRNAQNKNCPHRYKRFPAEIIGLNNDSTYRLRYNVSPYLLSLLRPKTYPEDYGDDKVVAYAPSPEQPFAEYVREMWIQHPANFAMDEILETERKIGMPLFMTYDPRMVATWDVTKVLQWLVDIGINERTQDLFKKKVVEGSMLLKLGTKTEDDCRDGLHVMLLGSHSKAIDQTNDSKTESQSVSVEMNAADDELGLSRIEMRNLFANIKHLQQQKGRSSQGFWDEFKRNMNGRPPLSNQSSSIQDTDTK